MGLSPLLPVLLPVRLSRRDVLTSKSAERLKSSSEVRSLSLYSESRPDELPPLNGGDIGLVIETGLEDPEEPDCFGVTKKFVGVLSSSDKGLIGADMSAVIVGSKVITAGSC